MDVATLKGNIDKLGTDLRAKFDTIQTEITTLKNKGGATADELDALGQSVASLDAAVVAFDPDAPVAAPGPAPDPAAGASA